MSGGKNGKDEYEHIHTLLLYIPQHKHRIKNVIPIIITLPD